MKRFLIFLFLGTSALMPAQVYDGEALIKQNATTSSDTGKANILQKLSKYYMDYGELDKADSCISIAIKLAERGGDKSIIAWVKIRQGQLVDARGDYDKAIEIYKSNDASLDTVKYSFIHGNILQNIAGAYYYKGAYTRSMNYYMRALKIRETILDSVGIGGSLMGIANVYNSMGQKEKSIPFFKDALGIFHRANNKRLESWILNNIGTSYVDIGKLDTAMIYYQKSMIIKKEIGDDFGLATTYNNLGSIFLSKKMHDSALFYYNQAYVIRKKMDDSHELAFSYWDIGAVYSKINQPEIALLWLDSSITTAEKSGSWDVLDDVYLLKAEMLSRLGKYKEAYEFMSKSKAARDTVFSIETAAQVNQLIAEYDSEKKEQEIILQRSEIKSANAFRKFLISLVGGSLILAIMLFLGYRRKRKTSEILATKNSEIEIQKKIVEEKNQDITDSITYALRIQQALLPSPEIHKRLLPDSFILYKPKDIVAGDYYMLEEFGYQTIIAAIDCTGHGVPGAFMTFVAYDLFNEAVNEHGITEPAAILNRMRKGISRILKQKGESRTDVKDGMDVSMCRLNEDKTILNYAGAYRPLWIIRDGACKEINGNKFSVSADDSIETTPFTQHEIPVFPGDVIYLFTDGYADQFGGPKGKKFMVSKLKGLLLEIHSLPMNEQQQKLEKAFLDWKGNQYQVDDVLVIGIRV